MKTYCPLPFRHVFVEPRGVKPCCSYATTEPISIEQWTQSKELSKIQSIFLKGQVPKGCQSCIQSEKTSNHSTRLGALKDYGDEVFTNTKIDYIDYRSSNICNFKCRSCEPYFSNGIANEIKSHESLKEFLSDESNYLTDIAVVPEYKTAATDEDDYKWIINHLSQIKKLMITGGEPTKIPSVKNIIEHIRANKIYDVQLLITSNASFTDPYWIEITKELPNIHWTLSLDAVGLAAEVIRHGTIWSTVSRNIETMFDISPSVNIGTVVTNLSLFQLKPLFRFVNDLEKKYSHRPNGRTQFIQICQWPHHMRPYILDEGMRRQALDYLQSFDRTNLQSTQIDALDGLIKIISNRKKPTRTRWARFKEHNNILDQIRGQSHAWLFTPAH